MKSTLFYLLFLVCTVVPIFALGLSNHGLWTADEPRVAEIGREMGLSGNWAVPTLDRKPFLEEPPLYYAALGATFRLLGVSDSIARLPSALFAFVGVVALFFLGMMFFGPRVGFLSSVIMTTCGEYFRVAHWVIVDSALACFVIVAVTFFAAAYLSEDRTKRFLFYAFCYVSCVLAFFTKGFIGVVIPGLAVLAFLFLRRDAKEIFRMHLWFGVLLFAVLVLPWFLALWRVGGTEYLEIFLIHNHVGRFAGGSSGHHQPFYYYLTQFPAGFLPWSILIVPVFSRAFRKRMEADGNERMGLLLCKCWFIAGFLFLSLASTKRVLYLMPIFAPISVMTAWYVDRVARGVGSARWERVFAALFGVLPLIAAVAVSIAYLFLGYRYEVPLSRVTTTGIISFSSVSAVLAIWALSRFKPTSGKFWFLSSASIYSLLVMGLIVVIPVLDHYKSFVPFCRAVERIVPPGAILYAYKPDETLRGAVPFYTGHFLGEVEAIEPLLRAREAGKAYVLVRDRKGELERELTANGRFAVLSRHGTDSDRSLLILGAEREQDRGISP